MILARCPACQTVFRVRPEQLRARQGQVRCGNCYHAFNALETLVEEAATTSAPPDDRPHTLAPATTSLFVLEEKYDPLDEEPSQDRTAARSISSQPDPAEAAAPREERPAFDRLPPLDDLDREPALRPDEDREPPPGWEADPDEESLAQEESPSRRTLMLWWAGIAILVIALLAQSVLVFREELARSLPSLRPALVAVCQSLGCTMPEPREAELISIETSDLRPDGQHPGHYLLDLALKNRAEFAQAYPHLELTLTDARDQTLVRRVFPPAEWLTTPNAPNRFPAHGDVSVKLRLAAPDVPAAGYRVYAFYP